MGKKFIVSLALLLLICSPAFSEPYLWAAHNTAVDMKDAKADLTTARFFCVTLEIADDDNELPEYGAQMFSITGGKYSYWSNNKMHNISESGTEEFKMMRVDQSAGHNYFKHIGTTDPGYVPVSYEGKWLHFLNDADTGLNGVNVSWKYGSEQGDQEGSATIPAFSSTSEQLADVVPYIEYVIDEETNKATGLKWRFVKKEDPSKAVTVDFDMTIEIRGCYNNGTAHLYEEEDFVLYDGIAGNALITKTAGETLEGTVNFGSGIEIHHLYMTLLRYYTGTDKNKCYQWRYFSPYDGEPVIRFYTEASINVPIEDGKINYKHAYYAKSGVSFNMFNIVNEAKYFTEGKITIEDGGYSLLDNLNIEIREIKDGEDITLPIYQTAESLGDSYNEFGISREMTHPFGEWYEWAIGLSDETAEKLSGKKFSWTFPGELSKFNGNGTFPEYMPITKILSSEGFFPCLELVMEGSKVTAIKYHIAQSPDIEAEYVPEILCYFDDVGIFDHSGNFQGLEEDIWDNFNPAHSGILKLENPVEYDAIDQVHSYFRVYPKVANSKQAFDEWIDAGNDHNDNANFIRYGWNCRTDFIDTRAVLIRDDDFNDMSGSIAGALNAESVNNVTRDELGGASEVTDTVKAQLETDDIEVLGGFSGVEVPDAGNYATKVNVLFNSELLDKLQGVAASDLHIFPLARQNTTASAVRTSGLVRASAASTTKATGQLLGADGKTLDTVGKRFIVALSLPKSDYYDLYIAKNKSKPQTPKEPVVDEPTVEEPAEQPTTEEPTVEEPTEQPTTEEPTTEKPTDQPKTEEPATEKPTVENPIETPTEEPAIDSPDQTPEDGHGTGDNDDSKYSDYSVQKIDSDIKDSIANLIGSDYEVFSFYDLLKSGTFSNFNNDVAFNRKNFAAISGDLTEAELAGVLPAFTLETDTPIIIILNIIAELANQKTLHFYPMKGAEVAGAGYKFVRSSANPDTTEDTSAVFFDSDGKTQITTLDAKNIYVAAAFSSGSYAPLILTGTAKSESEPEAEPEPEDGQGNNNEDDSNILGNSSGGCNSGAFISGALMLAALMSVKSKR